MRRIALLMTILSLLRAGFLQFSCAFGEEQGGGETPPGLATLLNGDARAATDALVDLTRDVDAVERNYPWLIQAAQSATGTLERDRLIAAGGERARGRFAYGKGGDDRQLLTLARMAECIWAAPPSACKTALVQRFVGDVGHLIDSGAVPKRRGLEIAFYALFRDDYIIPHPDVPTDGITRLLETHVEGADKETHEFLGNALGCIAKLCPDRRQEIVAILRQYFPERELSGGPPGTDCLGLGTRDPMSWDEYESLFRLSPEDLADVVRECLPHWRSQSAHGTAALDRLGVLQKRGDQDAERTLLALLAEGVQVRSISYLLVPKALPEDAPEHSKKLMDAVLDYCEAYITNSPSFPEFQEPCAVLHYYAAQWREGAKAGVGPLPSYGQKRVADILLDALGNNSVVLAGDSCLVTDGLRQLLRGSTPEIVEQIEKRLVEMSKDTTIGQGLPDAVRQAVQQEIGRLLEEARARRVASQSANASQQP